MKQLIILSLLFILVACGSSDDEKIDTESDNSNGLEIHENISGEVIEDAIKVIEIIDDGIEDNEIPKDDRFDWFIDKYEVEIDYVNDEEFESIMATTLLILNLEGYFDDTQDYPKDVDRLYKTMETGKYQRLYKSNSYYTEYYDSVADAFYEENTEVTNTDESELNNEPLEIENEDKDENEEDANDYEDNVIDIDWDVNNIVDVDLDNTTITDLRINEDASTDEERYIVLIDLEWDVKNKPKTTKDMLDMYSDHLAANLSENELIYELVLFWTVPYHNESESILKRQYENRDGGMYLEDEMKDVNVFN